MIAVSSQTAAALALHAAESGWVMFLQVMPPGIAGPIRIEGVEGRNLIDRLNTIADDNPYPINLIGMLQSQMPREDAEVIANEFGAFQVQGWWFEPTPEILTFIRNDAQSALSILLAQTHPGGLSDAPVDIEEIARIIGVSVPTVRRMVKAGEIPFLKFGRNYRFVPNDVIASIRSA